MQRQAVMKRLRLPTVAQITCALSLTLPLTAATVSVPNDLEWKMFADDKVAACSVVLSAHPDGGVFVGIDKNGSLGKGKGNGYILKFIDSDNDGVADSHTTFAPMESVRGLMAVGDKLYVLHSTWKDAKTYDTAYVSVLEDKNKDGIADGPPKTLITGISAPTYNNSRGVDHSTNGIRMGIDGWIYIAMGDFGIVDAEGTDGTKLTVLGGGVIRVRPDGTEMEEYIHGTRNICDIAIDPFMNVYTRGNTNDGGGWNIRFIHEIQSGEYGYPKLFKRYTDEILPALVDLGGGSGTGSMFFQEPGWPEKYNNVPLMGDWGRSHIYIHRITPNGASFTQEQEDYIKVGKMTDIDVDGSGRMYICSWEGSGFGGGKGGYVVRVTPKGWTYKPFPNLAEASAGDLIKYLQSDSATWRFHASQEIVNRKAADAKALIEVINKKSASLEARVAAVFTLKQLAGDDANADLLKASADVSIREWALRAIADRIPQNKKVEIAPFVAALKESSNPRIQVAAAVALGRIGNKAAAKDLIAVAHMPDKDGSDDEGEQEDQGSGKSAFASQVLKDKDMATVDLDITGWKEIHITVLDGGDGDGNDHAGIFEPYLIKKDGSKTKLTDLKWTKAVGGWGSTNVDKDCRKEPLKAMNGKPFSFGIGTHAVARIIYKFPKKENFVRFQATLGHTDGGGGGITFEMDKKAMPTAYGENVEGEHAKPNKDIIVPHIAVQALIKLKAVEACVDAIGSSNASGAYWAMRYIHDDGLVKVLANKLASVKDPKTERDILKTLIRLHNDEIPYDGKWWWSTKPDTRGPYYKPTPWSGTPIVASALKAYWAKASDAQKSFVAKAMSYDRVEIEGIDAAKYAKMKTETVAKEEVVDLSKILNQSGQVGKMSVEDVITALNTVKGDTSKGEALFMRQGCIACHSWKKGQPERGPFMGAVGGILSREDIAMSILRPNASISQGFRSYNITMKDGTVHSGFITSELDGVVTMRNIAGIVTQLKDADIKSRDELPTSMMPQGLAAGMSLQEFANLVDWLKSNK